MRDQMHRLSQVESSAIHVLSIYLDMQPQVSGNRPSIRPGLVTLKERLRDIEKSLLPRGKRLDAFRADRDYIEQALEKDVPSSVRGLALFVAVDRGITEIVTTEVPFETEVIFAPIFDLFQLVHMEEDEETAAIALVDTNSSRFLVMHFGRLDEAGGPDEDPFWYRQRRDPGPNKPHYQRHIDMHRNQFAEEAATAFAHLIENQAAKRVILAGNVEAVPLFRAKLPKTVLDLVVSEPLRIDFHAPRNEVDAKVEPILARAEEAQEQQLGDQVIEATQAGKYGVIGIENTRHALEMGQVSTLVLDAQTTLPSDERREIVRLALLTSAQIEILAHHDRFHTLGGIGAILRFAPEAIGDVNNQWVSA